MAHLLIVEDDELLRDALGSLLGQAGHQVSMAPDGESALAELADGRFEGVVLDLGLPRIDGLTVLQRLRVQLPTLPVLILTARDGVEDRVAGLNAGADDYLTKPFNGDELKARLQSMLRRSKLPAFGQADTSVGKDRQPLLRVDTDVPRAWLQDDMVELTQREWELLALLFRRQGQVVSREDVFAAWQSGAGEAGAMASNALEVYVHRLRRKLAHPALHIRNIRGLGYMMELGAR
ncbi:response regulator transcription factor [Comamonadaceae bacterium G21597-S1]|nr:response regulator transcription factor [Comamonadaceae bacterium G21597-S1]